VDAPRSVKSVSPAVVKSVVTSTDGTDASEVAAVAETFLGFNRNRPNNRFEQFRCPLSSAIVEPVAKVSGVVVRCVCPGGKDLWAAGNFRSISTLDQ
jgi:hypothetical protein